MKAYKLSESVIEAELSKLLNTYINVNLEKETTDTLFYSLRIKKPKYFDLYNWLKKEIGENNFEIIVNSSEGSFQICLEENVTIRYIKQIIDKVIDRGLSNSISVDDLGRIIIKFDTEIPF